MPEVPQPAAQQWNIPPELYNQFAGMHFQQMPVNEDMRAMEYFNKFKRVSFSGREDVNDFIQAIETRTRVGFTDYQKIYVVELSLEGAALDWFRQEISANMRMMMWDQFRERFVNRFMPVAMRNSLRWQFLQIKKGNRSVNEYTDEFYRLAHKVPDVMANDAWAAHVYVTGLGE